MVRLLFVLGLLSACGGCHFVTQPLSDRNPLASSQTSSGHIDLEIVFAKLPAKDPVFGEHLWRDVDEQVLESSLRGRLDREGFRLGILSGSIPPALSQALHLGEHANENEQQFSAEELESDSPVTLRLLQTRSGHRGEITTAKPIDQLPLLVSKEGNLQGQTFAKAEPRISIRPVSEPNGNVRLELIPEIEHGEARPQFVSSDGISRLQAGRPKHRFDDLRTSVSLAPGQMLILSCSETADGRVGQYFFTEKSEGQLLRKLVVVRLASGGSRPLYENEPTVVEDLGSEE